MTDQTYPWLKDYPPKPDWHMDIPPGLMTEALEKTAARKGREQAFDFLGKTYDWTSLMDGVNRFAAGLQKLGVQKGQKVGLFLPNCPLSLIAYYGILKTGATVVNYNPLYVRDELAYQIEDSETDIMVTLDLAMLTDKMEEMLSDTRLERLIIGKFAEMLPFPKNLLFPLLKKSDIANVKPSERITWLSDLMNNDGQPAKVEIDPLEDVALLQYTGGTTGTPKAAMLTHMNIYANAVQAYANFPEPDMSVDNGHEKMLAALPFFHVFAMTVCLNMAVLAGMEIVTIPRFDLNDALNLIHKKKPKYMPAVPAIFSAMNNHPKIADYDLSSLDFCISGGAPLPVEVKKKFEEKTGCTVVEGYGLTESSPVATVNPPFGENVAGSIGLPLPGTIIEIIDPDDKTTAMPIGERGEVCIRGPQVMKGYFNRPNETANVLRPTDDGGLRLHTGDIATMDERGYTFIVDRIKDLIITNGYNVYPRHVEEAIYKHPNVEECIVAGLPDANRGEIVKAWIKLKEGRELTADELRSFLEEKISKIEMPRRIEFRDKPLPKTMIGKLSRKDIVAEEPSS
ncbi:MAG: long-chain fatty acid--CoA ligase [Rhodospirillales bacterium]|nr:long-chain fatty acid--CoA ligase [Rhodospirillales bacterium]